MKSQKQTQNRLLVDSEENIIPINKKASLTEEDINLVYVFRENEFLHEVDGMVVRDNKSNSFRFEIPDIDIDDQPALNDMKKKAEAPTWIRKCPSPVVLCRKLVEIGSVYDDLLVRGLWEAFYAEYSKK